MARICVITLDPSEGGGIRTKLTAFLQYAASRNHVCDLYFPTDHNFQEANVESLRGIGSVGGLYPIQRAEKVPDFLRSDLFGRRCKIAPGYDAYVLVAGYLHQGLPFAYQKKPFIAWIAGAFGSEVKAMPRIKFKHYLLYNPVTNYLALRQEILGNTMAKAVLVDSRSSAQDLQSEIGIPIDQITVLPSPVNVETLLPGEPLAEPHRYILSVARLDRRKDFPTLLKAFRKVIDNYENVQLRVVGEGIDRPNIEKLIVQLKLTNHVTLLGFLPEEELIEQYLGASLFTLASLQEGIGIVFLEAMAHGLPVVATDSGGSADPIDHGETGFLVPVGDWESLGQYILQILQDPELAERLGKVGRKKVTENYSFKVISQVLDSALEEVFGLHPVN